MPSYRFCRPDDLTLIIRAINACYLMHYPDEPAMTEERLKEHMTLFHVRPGNCMVALERQQPVGVVVSTKRDYGVWIQALGCQPALQRRGIATQLLEALVRKIAIQRAPLVTVDVPTTNTPARRFFEAVHFTVRGRYVSYQGFLTEVPGIPGSIEAVPPPDLLAYYAPFHTIPACWERKAESLAGYGTLPQGYAYYAQGTVQGYLIHRGNTILDLALAPQADAKQVSAVLLGRMRAAGWTHATLAKVPEDEPIGPVLAFLGFTPTVDYLLMGQDLQ
ncbi:MAG TPA: GNAT family N-acetyltransferase [Candidatus Saccharimonadia bacterium]|nr:GNAT family N-acetyltransferase [Candidatus Saccharimonadia bacterium]